MQQYQPLKYATIGLRLLIGIATAIIGTYAIKTLFPEISGVATDKYEIWERVLELHEIITTEVENATN